MISPEVEELLESLYQYEIEDGLKEYLDYLKK